MIQTLEGFSKKFHKRNQVGSNGIDWTITWNIAIIEDDKLWKLLKLALPYEVVINEEYYHQYEKPYKWLIENSTGLWSHAQLLFIFEKEEDAVAFKLRWV